MALNTLSLRGRIILDAMLALLFVTAFGFWLTGEAVHELLGAAMFILLAVHLAAGWAWVKNLRTGAFNMRRRCTTLVNILLFLALAVVFGSGLAAFLELGDGMATRQIHAVAAHWSLVLTGVHLGLYWESVIGGIRAAAKDFFGQWLWAAHLPKAGLLFALYGLWASCERGMGAKLFLGFSYDFWDETWPSVLYFINYFAVMSVYIAATRYFLRACAQGKTPCRLIRGVRPHFCRARRGR